MSGCESRFPKSLIEFQGRLATESACAAYLFERRWPEGFVCPGCGAHRAWLLRTKAFTYECAACRRQTSVTAGTIMHASKLPLTMWFWAAFLMATHSNGISALQLQSQLGLGSYRTAWMLCAKLRRAMVNPEREPLCGLVEADETIIPFRTKQDPMVLPAGRSAVGKMLVAGAVEVAGGTPRRARLKVIESFGKDEIHAFVLSAVAPQTQLVTDAWPSYQGVPGVGHKAITIGPMAAHVALPWIERDIPAGRLIHVILDNYGSHKDPKVRAWLGRHPRWTFHFIPTSASWLNAVEGFFAKLTRRRLKRGVFHSLVDLQAAIKRYLDDHNQNSKPFVWTADPERIIAAANRGYQMLDSIH